MLQSELLGQRWARLPGLERVPATGAAVLTFDDGPDPDATPALLDALDSAGARATFFLAGEQLIRHHEIALETAARGHELALHCFAHLDHDALSDDEAHDELVRGLWAFESILGRRPRWYRPPFGRMTDASHAASLELGLAVVYWSASGRDWEPRSAAEIAGELTDGLVGGAIVLLHDSARYASRASAQASVGATRLLAASAAERGIALRSLGELVEANVRERSDA